MEYYIFKNKRWKVVSSGVFFKFEGSCYCAGSGNGEYYLENNEHGFSYFHENKKDIKFEYCWKGKILH